MGGMKRLIEQEEEQRRVATRIALEAGVLKSCEVHHEIYDPMGGNIENAYRLGNYKITHGEITIFDSRKEMTDTILAVVNDAAMECWDCAKVRRED